MKKIFVSYSHRNMDWVAEDGKYALISWLSKQLKRDDIDVWTDHALNQLIGAEYNTLIEKEIQQADMAIMMISQDFVASDYIMDREVPLIKKRWQKGEMKLFPLLLTPITDRDKERFSWIFNFQIYPNEATTLISYFADEVKWETSKVEILNNVFNRLVENKALPKPETLKNKVISESENSERQKNIEVELKRVTEENAALQKELEKLKNIEVELKRVTEEKAALQKELEKLKNIEVELKRVTEENAALQKELEAREKTKSQSKTNNGESTTFNVNGVSFDMITVKGSTFWMGAQKADPYKPNFDSDCDDDERPIHQVTLSDYMIGKYEVTQAQWEAVMGSNPSYYKGNNLPVEGVSWNDARKFITKLNQKTGRQFRLPTEAEWEFAARGGNKSKGYKYSGSNTIGNVAWYEDISGDETHPVGQKTPNELGIYDMSGNVWEWCQDWYGKYNSGSQTNPTGPSSGSYRVLRGGSRGDDAGLCRVSLRDDFAPDYRDYYCGFRVVLLP